jgi:hypothetical protein
MHACMHAASAACPACLLRSTSGCPALPACALGACSKNHPPPNLPQPACACVPACSKKLAPAVAADLQVHIVGSGALPAEAAAVLQQNARWVQFHGYLSDELLGMLYASVKVGGLAGRGEFGRVLPAAGDFAIRGCVPGLVHCIVKGVGGMLCGGGQEEGRSGGRERKLEF